MASLWEYRIVKYKNGIYEVQKRHLHKGNELDWKPHTVQIATFEDCLKKFDELRHEEQFEIILTEKEADNGKA